VTGYYLELEAVEDVRKVGMKGYGFSLIDGPGTPCFGLIRRWIVGLRLSNTDDWAAPFEKHHVTPPAIHAANPLPRSHNSKPGLP